MSLQEKKEKLLKELIEHGYLKSKDVVSAFRKVPRENFVPENLKKYAYINEPLPIGDGQTISQPLTVAFMTEFLDAKKDYKILEVGTGSGYQAAILSHIVGPKGKIITTEINEKLVEFAKNNLKNYKNVFVINFDGSKGYEKEAPYDRIIVTASAPDIPRPLIEQLKDGGKIIIPIGDEMYLIEKIGNKIKKSMLGYFVFVPLIGEYGYK
ncbi:MAG: protein-L-isoaspartate(D-aspartate) O-methyltransferase [Candidatus Aenigmatarchaeota archaeon]